MNLQEITQDDIMPMVAVNELCLDSRAAKPGDLFIALAERDEDRLRHTTEALSKGAVAVLTEAPLKDSALEAVYVFEDLRARLGEMVSRFFGDPSSDLTLLAVTGTNGKSSVVHLGAQALNLLGVQASLIGTLGSGRPGDLKPATLTTPDVVTLQRELRTLKTLGSEVILIEASSHGLDQGRLDGVRIHSAAFTNLTHDHLDYHGTLEAYGQAKATLFRWPALEVAIVNIDDAFGKQLARETTAKKVVTYGIENPIADVVAREVRTTHQGVSFELKAFDQSLRAETALLGRFNLSNVLAVVACLIEQGHALADIASILPRLQSPPGRLERIGLPVGEALIDFAHTPDAVASVLQTLREHARGRIVTLIGCGGDRDRSKRSLMGRIAFELSDEVIFTSDNPRSESPLAIAREMCASLPDSFSPIIELDRREAIAQGMARLSSDDLLVILGKGHEDYQEISGIKHAFSDRATIESLMSQGAAAHG